MRRSPAKSIAAVDLFCGAGGLSYGLQRAGISIVKGVDLDPTCEYPFTANVGASFLCQDVTTLSSAAVERFYPKGAVRLLAGCAPCRPFSPLRHGEDTSKDGEWGLLNQFGRLIRDLEPELVTIENVPNLECQPVFERLVDTLDEVGYDVDWGSVYCPTFGIAQHRRRLVLVASLLGPVRVPLGKWTKENFETVRSTIGDLPPVKAGQADPSDRLHVARAMSETNDLRLRASTPGGTWRDWPKALRAECHKRSTGKNFGNVYARMKWEEPSPTITTLAHSFGSGRFGHPVQNRSITLREAALLQSFPRAYQFVRPKERVRLTSVGRLIGNAVPPKLAQAIGKELVRAAVAESC